MAEEWELVDGLINRLKAVDVEDRRAIGCTGEAAETSKRMYFNTLNPE